MDGWQEEKGLLARCLAMILRQDSIIPSPSCRRCLHPVLSCTLRGLVRRDTLIARTLHCPPADSRGDYENLVKVTRPCLVVACCDINRPRRAISDDPNTWPAAGEPWRQTRRALGRKSHRIRCQIRTRSWAFRRSG